jgi:RNA polymerase sigma-70 factor (ECF subfamily)
VSRETLTRDGAAALQVLERLPQRYASALEWKYGDDMTVEEIARQLDLSVAATQSLLARARDAFRELWHMLAAGSES